MKKLIAYVLSALCYYPAHMFSLLFGASDSFSFLYTPYNRLMIWSGDIEEWGGIEFNWGSKYNKDENEHQEEN